MLPAAAGILPAAPCLPSGELRIRNVFALTCAEAVRQYAGQDGQNARAPPVTSPCESCNSIAARAATAHQTYRWWRARRDCPDRI